MTTHDWSVSGLCVTARPADLDAVEAMLDSIPGTEVHARDRHGGRLVVIQERASIEEHEKALRHLQSLPHVLTAELVIHYRNPLGRPISNRSGGTP